MTEFTDLLKQFEPEEESLKDDSKVPILVVDDDESIRRGLTRVFSKKYEVLTAECGKEAVNALSDAVHCVILDVKMKEQNGFATYPKLKAKSPNVPIIFYTAFQSEHDLQGVINKFKPEGYVDKGQDVTFLDNLVGNAVHKYELILQNDEYKRDLEGNEKKGADLFFTFFRPPRTTQLNSTSQLFGNLSSKFLTGY
ncbi:MAG: response regulator [Deltaproteobacteria bacterium]|nr:response regulator [Deltaproteobacteria bacterium]